MTRDSLLVDSHGRVLRDLRVSITDRCNFRCLYCLPETEAAQNFYRGRWATLPDSKPIAHQWQPRAKILTFEEIQRVVRIAVGLGAVSLRPVFGGFNGGVGAHDKDLSRPSPKRKAPPGRLSGKRTVDQRRTTTLAPTRARL